MEMDILGLLLEMVWAKIEDHIKSFTFFCYWVGFQNKNLLQKWSFTHLNQSTILIIRRRFQHFHLDHIQGQGGLLSQPGNIFEPRVFYGFFSFLHFS